MTAARSCGDCGYWHPFADCGPDPDGTYPCREGHYGCALTLRGLCRAERLAAAADADLAPCPYRVGKRLCTAGPDGHAGPHDWPAPDPRNPDCLPLAPGCGGLIG